MLNKKKLFFNNLLGEWILTKNIYIINTKKVSLYKESVKIFNEKIDKINNQYIITNNNLYNKKDNFIRVSENSILKDFNLYKNTYINKYINQEQLKIQVAYDNIQYEENIYSINQNLKISIGILLKKNKYKCIIFCSYIKKI